MQILLLFLVCLPEGRWMDYWTGIEHVGPKDLVYRTPENRGGGLFLKSGSIVPMWPEVSYVGERLIEKIRLLVYPGEEQASECTLYEDDGDSLEYKKGAVAKTTFRCRRESDRICLTVSPRQGSYAGMPQIRYYTITVFCENPAEVRINGVQMEQTLLGMKTERFIQHTPDRYQEHTLPRGVKGWEYNLETRAVQLTAYEDSSKEKELFIEVSF